MLFLSKGGGQEILTASVCHGGHVPYDRSGAPAPSCGPGSEARAKQERGAAGGRGVSAGGQRDVGDVPKGQVPAPGWCPALPALLLGLLSSSVDGPVADWVELATDGGHSAVK